MHTDVTQQDSALKSYLAETRAQQGCTQATQAAARVVTHPPRLQRNLEQAKQEAAALGSTQY